MSQKTLQTLNEEEQLDFVERVLEQQKAMVQIPVLTQEENQHVKKDGGTIQQKLQQVQNERRRRHKS